MLAHGCGVTTLSMADFKLPMGPHWEHIVLRSGEPMLGDSSTPLPGRSVPFFMQTRMLWRVQREHS